MVGASDIGQEWYRDVLTHFAYASRHYGISLLYLTQDLTQLATGYRKNFDFVICLEAPIQDQNLMFVELLSNTFRGQCGITIFLWCIKKKDSIKSGLK